MGFRSTVISEVTDTIWPEWFVAKYEKYINISDCLSTKSEYKSYGEIIKDLPEDIQQAINWEERRMAFIIAYLHECGGITRCQIEKDAIKWSEPLKWRNTKEIEHNYCYGCSDA